MALISHFTFAYSIHRAFASATLRTKSMSQTILHMSTDTSTTYPELDLGEFENVKFQQVDGTNTFGKYRLEATVKASEFEGELCVDITIRYISSARISMSRICRLSLRIYPSHLNRSQSLIR